MQKFLAGLIILNICISISNHLKLKKMNKDMQELSDGLDEANAKIEKVAADVKNLHDQVTSVTADQPTAEEWAAVKSKVVNMNSALQTVDDATADAPAPGDGTTQG